MMKAWSIVFALSALCSGEVVKKIPLKYVSECYYTAPLGVGTPTSIYNVAVITRSRVTSFWDAYQFLPGLPYGVKKFRSGESKSFIVDYRHPDSVTKSAGWISWSPLRVNDVMSLNGGAIPRQNFTLAQGWKHYVNASYHLPAIDGFLGLGYSIEPNFASGIYSSPLHGYMKTLELDLFSLYFNGTAKKGQENAGQITIGGLDKDHCEEWADVKKSASSDSDWEFVVNRVQIGSESLPSYSLATLANEEEKMTVPANVHRRFYRIYSRLGVKVEYFSMTADCKQVPSLPSISFFSNEVKFEILPEEMFLKEGDKCTFHYYHNTNQQWLLPQFFHNKYCQAYDISTKTLKFAKSKAQ